MILAHKGLSQIIFRQLASGGGGGGGGVTLTNQAFFSQEEGWPLPEKTLEGDRRCCKKALHPNHYAEVLETVGEAAADEEEEEEEKEQEQQEDTEDSGGESGDDKCMVCGEKEEDVVDIEDWVACEMCSQ